VQQEQPEIDMITANTVGQTVHRRTRQGQKAAAMQMPTLEGDHARVLRLFNGFTPTVHLVERAEAFAPQRAWDIADELERTGLIELVH